MMLAHSYSLSVRRSSALLWRGRHNLARDLTRRGISSDTPRTNTFDTENFQVAYGKKSMVDLARTIFIFNLCRLQSVVKNSDALLSASRKIFGHQLTNAILRRTFFAQFCGGENEEDIKPTIEKLHERNVGAILDYAAEADLERSEEDANEESGSHEATVARVYSYSSERMCDANKLIFMKGIEAVHNVTPDGFAAIKVTGLGNPQLLLRVSKMKRETLSLFSRFDKNSDGVLSRDEFLEAFGKMFNSDDESRAEHLFEEGKLLAKPRIVQTSGSEDVDSLDVVDWSRLMSSAEISSLTKLCKDEGPLFRASLTDEELQLMEDMYSRLDDLASLASENGVRLMVDAEQTYFQPAIDAMVVRLQRRFNTKACTIFNTYQCYLKDSRDRLERDIERSKREEYHFAAKLVRGAYMYSERKLALENGVESPIHETLEDTHRSFNENLSYILDFMEDSNRTGKARAEVMVATHNLQSIELAVERMRALEIDPKVGGVYFGQLLGMADNLTFPLGASGHKAYKYVPYGPLDEVVPYLVRRAHENSDMMGNASKEVGLLWKELSRRVTGGA